MPGRSNLPKHSTKGNELNSRTKKKKRRQRVSNVVVTIDGKPIELTDAILLSGDSLESLRRQCHSSQNEVQYQIRELHKLADQTRFTLLGIIAATPKYRVTVGSNTDHVCTDLFESVLGAFDDNEDVGRREQFRRAALEAAALVHPHALPFACGRIAEKFREVGIKGLLPQALVKDARQLLGTQRQAISAEQAAREFIANSKGKLLALNDEAFSEETLAEVPVVAFFGGEFYLYGGKCWRRVTDLELNALVSGFLQRADHGEQVSARFVNDVVTNLRGATLLPQLGQTLPFHIDNVVEEKFSPSLFLGFQNGQINLNETLAGSDDLYCHDPRHFSTVVLPYEYDPDARCPLWLESIHEILCPPASGQRADDNRISLLQEFFGRTLSGPNISADKALVLVGEGGTGNSTIALTLGKMLGTANTSHVPIDKIGGEFRLATMKDKLANIAGDMSWIDRIDEGVLKMLVTGDWIDVNRKHKDPIPMRPTTKLLFGTNILPPFHDRSRGIWRRLILMPMYCYFSGDRNDIQRAERLVVELPGILNWALEGARRFQRQGGYSDCGVCHDYLEEHRFHSDPVRQFVAECCVVSPGRSVKKEALYGAYRDWCERKGHNRYPLADNAFGKQILRITGVSGDRESRGNVRKYLYEGIALLPRYAEEDVFEYDTSEFLHLVSEASRLV